MVYADGAIDEQLEPILAKNQINKMYKQWEENNQ